jgi:hypothetical protein
MQRFHDQYASDAPAAALCLRISRTGRNLRNEKVTRASGLTPLSPRHLVVRRHLSSVDSDSLRLGEASRREYLLDERVLAFAVVVNIDRGSRYAFLDSRIASRRAGFARTVSLIARWFRNEREPSTVT